MKALINLFAFACLCIGVACTILVGGFYLGYATYEPKCNTIASAFTKNCK
jgi:hypothetical protein